ncbi:MAG TPA: hypothetical protein VK923_02995 [Euzebyales bacterium]|nr:hypothetical protein [Euzebyales bacterium]
MGDSAAGDHADQCQSCPVCLLLRAFDDLPHQVRAHLAAAGRELLLALRAAVDDVGTAARPGDDVWIDERCGTSPDTSPPDDRAHHHPAPAAPLRRIAVQ